MCRNVEKKYHLCYCRNCLWFEAMAITSKQAAFVTGIREMKRFIQKYTKRNVTTIPLTQVDGY
jgi:hypothetical protein